MKAFDQSSVCFRHEFGALVACLVKRFGTAHLERIEDAVQQGLSKALEHWPHSGVPDNPSAWLYTVSYRILVSDLRTEARLLSDDSLGWPENLETTDIPEVTLKHELESSLLQMLFVACHQAVPFESQLVFTLKTLCGFSIDEIAERLFISKANTYKRFNRAKEILKSQSPEFDSLNVQELMNRLPVVLNVLYSLFSEGYFSNNENELIRVDLCQDALFLTTILCQHKQYAVPETQALCALMLLHFSMLNARKNEIKELACFSLQQRSQSDIQYLNKGLQYLEASARGERISRYHVEANIAAEYAIAPSFQEIRWGKIVSSYELLTEVVPGNSIHLLNTAVALIHWGKPDEALARLNAFEAPSWLKQSHIWFAVRAYTYLHVERFKEAKENAHEAIKRAPTDLVKQKLFTRLSRCFDGKGTKAQDAL